jgi:hypothetical protein
MKRKKIGKNLMELFLEKMLRFYRTRRITNRAKSFFSRPVENLPARKTDRWWEVATRVPKDLIFRKGPSEPTRIYRKAGDMVDNKQLTMPRAYKLNYYLLVFLWLGMRIS